MSGLLIAAVWIFWLGVWRAVEKGRADARWRLGPDAPRSLPDAGAIPQLAVVIPARDEARNIEACVRAVRASDHPWIDVLVYDDGSTDGTAELAEKAGARVVRGSGELPEGWKGKTWALQRATEHVSAPWILFLDADVRVAPEALLRAHVYALREQVQLLSGLGRLTMESFWEKVIQPSVSGLIIAGNRMEVVNDPARPDKAIANGQFILVDGRAYSALGGHAVVRDDILDDIGLARAFSAAGHKVRCLFMRHLFSCRMYHGFSEIWEGWTKNLYAGMHRRPGLVVLLVAVVTLYFLVPYPLLFLSLLHGAWAEAAGWTLVVVTLHLVRLRMDETFEQEPLYGLLQPLGALLLVGLLLDSLRRTHTGRLRWKGRVYRG